MEQTIKFTKKNTLAVKGIAISFLLCYHCFSQTARMGGAKVSFWPLQQNLAMLISLCMVHCVGSIAVDIPVWQEENCIQCNRCA